MQTSWLLALAGGALIGAAAALLMLTHGRIAGISGVVGSLLPPGAARDRGWRLAFVVGLLVPGAVAAVVAPEAIGASVRPLAWVAVAGILVGAGTPLGSGCTSGHGVCGLARLSRRSLAAVLTFMTTGIITVAVVRGLS
ncbi:MAG: YeeE/YedE family protein [Kofleriaceae bacterium]